MYRSIVFSFLSLLPFSLQTDDDDDDVFCFLCFRLAKTNVVVVFVDFSSFDRSLAFFASRLARRSLILTIQPCGCLTFASVVAIFLFFSSRLALSVYINIYICMDVDMCRRRLIINECSRVLHDCLLIELLNQ